MRARLAPLAELRAGYAAGVADEDDALGVAVAQRDIGVGGRTSGRRRNDLLHERLRLRPGRPAPAPASARCRPRARLRDRVRAGSRSRAARRARIARAAAHRQDAGHQVAAVVDLRQQVRIWPAVGHLGDAPQGAIGIGPVDVAPATVPVRRGERCPVPSTTRSNGPCSASLRVEQQAAARRARDWRASRPQAVIGTAGAAPRRTAARNSAPRWMPIPNRDGPSSR